MRGVRPALMTGVVACCLVGASSVTARPQGGAPVVLVTAERQNLLLAASLPDGRARSHGVRTETRSSRSVARLALRPVDVRQHTRSERDERSS
jgi:hypothetical protein